MNVTSNDRMLDVMRHATAWPSCYRNYFIAGPGHADESALCEAVSKGYMTQAPYPLAGDASIYRVTKKGKRCLAQGDW